MASTVTIAQAAAADLPTLAHIMPLAMQADLINRTLFPDSIYDLTLTSKALLSSYEADFRKPNMHFFKATDNATGEIVGFGNLSFVDNAASAAVPLTETAEKSEPPSPPEGMNMVFAGRLFGSLAAKRIRHMSAYSRYVAWYGLHVVPTHQRRGIGSALLKYGLDMLGAGALPVWLSTQMRGRNLYLKWGFEDVDSLDIDLKEFGGEWSGYGVHRSPCMLRMPGGTNTAENLKPK
ncbi:hypothetical protein FIBSPDRAFT_367977 [Athelia psychrophila]|uniref:N-acetyltransferase domain-containing protein n=1 Tax=Athelia psychrophila TaxID=1759441 RepID=A0A166P7V7_9AGAM|nr:hypothetical protein FIBSPDRAFT_367977 [Fibularhizoctonia sp. CBS 109695]